MHQGEFAQNLKAQSIHKNNMKIYTIIAIIYMSWLFPAWAEPTSEKEKREFADFYRKAIKLAEEFPNKLEVKTIFVDFDCDGNDEALATSYSSFGETGWLWTAFRKKSDKWSPINGYDSDSKSISLYSSIFARPSEIFSVSQHDGSIEFLILAESYDKLAPDGKGPLNKTRFYLDKDGVLQQEKVKDLERYLAYRVSGHQWPEGTLIKRLEALKVDIFKD